MKIQDVCIYGAGAIGAYMIWGLSEKLGSNLKVIAEGDRAEKLRRDGLMINDQHYDLQVVSPEEARGTDLVIVCVKYGSLDSVIEKIDKVVADNTIVLSLLNGIDSEERIGARVGMEHLVYSIIKIASARNADGIRFKAPAGMMGIYFGENPSNGSTDLLNQADMVAAIAELFDNTPLCYHISENIKVDLWSKFALNVAENLPQAIIGCGMGGYFDSEYVDRVRTMLREEVFALAKAQDIEIPLNMAMTKVGNAIKKEARFSTLQDLDAGRHTEVDMLAGEAIRQGKKYGIPTPCNEIVYNIICALEEKNDGKFNYE